MSALPVRFERLSTLAVASGGCGIAYEVLYSRVLTTYLGDAFHVAAAILISFLFGVGLGSVLSYRLARWLWVLELATGLYALGFAAVLVIAPDALLGLVARGFAAIAFGVALSLVPAVLIGVSVPAFSLFVREHLTHGDETAAFRRVYALYNLGAVGCVLAMEYWVQRNLGAASSLALLATVNLAVAVSVKRIPAPRLTTPEVSGPADEQRWGRAAVFLASAVSGLYQLFLLKLVGTVFGPFHENFSVVLAVSLGGIALGTALVRRLGWSLRSLLWIGAAVVAIDFSLVRGWVYAWALVSDGVAGWPFGATIAKVAVVTAIGLVPAMVFGATIPALAVSSPDGRTPGQLLWVSSLGNCVGYLAAVLVVWERLSYGAIAVAVCLGLVAAAALTEKAPGAQPLGWRRAWVVPALGVLAIVWSDALFALSYRDYIGLAALRRSLGAVVDVQVTRRFDSEVKLVKTRQGNLEVVINGYRSLVASTSGRTNLKELVVGVAPALYPPRRDRALVLGVGTGITAGATATLFEHTTGVEISPAVVEVLESFKENNLGLRQRKGFELVIDDGVAMLARDATQYDAIINTVTSPLYFQSSKLYTRDFFELVKRHLSEGGVYATWFDARVTQEGAISIFRTLQESFADCHLIFLSPVYTEAICGASKLTPRLLDDATLPAELVAHFRTDRLGLSISQLLRSLVLPRNQIAGGRWDADANTFDRPRLEFLMSSVALARPNRADAWTPYDLAGADLEADAFSSGPIDTERRCYAFRAVGDHAYPACTAWQASGAPTVPGYLARVADYLETEGTFAERLSIALQLERAGRLDKARSIADALAPNLPGSLALAALQVRTRARLGDRISDQELDTLYRRGPLDPDVRRALAWASLQRGDAAAALAHLGVLKALGTAADPTDERLRAAATEAQGTGQEITP